jgi:hypothetical protein
MKNRIQENIDNPRELERLYRENGSSFKRAFDEVYPEIAHNPVAQVWKERFHFESTDISWGSRSELKLVLILCLLAATVAKIPAFTSVREEFFYPRNLSFIVFPFLIVYFIWKQESSWNKRAFIAFAIFGSALYINLLPKNSDSDTFLLACIHLPLFLWSVLSVAFVGEASDKNEKRLAFLRYNGDLLVMNTVILIAGAILTGITVGLFSLIEVDIIEFYSQNIVVWGAASSPIVATYLIQSNPQLVNKVSPVIAKVFTPLVLITLVVYLAAVFTVGKDPYNDRDFLLLFNVMLIGVMAIIFFSIAETARKTRSKIETYQLLALSVVTIVVNCVALSAILFRISEWGITPNRMAVLGGNVLMLINLSILTFQLAKGFINRDEVSQPEKSISSFLPIYAAWTIIVTFLFPLLFQFG